MKKLICLLIVFIAISLSASAQMNIVKFHSGNFLPSRFKLQYERKLNDKFSVGAIGSFFMHNYFGYRVEPYSRIYLGKTSSTFNGMYFQLKGHYTLVTDKTPERELIEEYGTSMAIGYEKVFSSGLCFDFFAGSRISNTPYKSISESSELFNLLYCLPVDLGFSVGYAF